MELYEATKGEGSAKGQQHLELEIGALDKKRQPINELPFIVIWLAKVRQETFILLSSPSLLPKQRIDCLRTTIRLSSHKPFAARVLVFL